MIPEYERAHMTAKMSINEAAHKEATIQYDNAVIAYEEEQARGIRLFEEHQSLLQAIAENDRRIESAREVMVDMRKRAKTTFEMRFADPEGQKAKEPSATMRVLDTAFAPPPLAGTV